MVGSISQNFENLTLGSCIGWLHSDQKGFLDVATDLICAGLQKNQKILQIASSVEEFIIPQVSSNQSPKIFSKNGSNFTYQSEQYENILLSDIKDSSGNLELKIFLKSLRDISTQAIKDGYSSLLAICNMSQAFKSSPNPVTSSTVSAALSASYATKNSYFLNEWKAALNLVSLASDTILVCHYDRQLHKSKDLLNVLTIYPQLLVGKKVYDNIYFLRSDKSQEANINDILLNKALEAFEESGKGDDITASGKIDLSIDRTYSNGSANSLNIRKDFQDSNKTETTLLKSQYENLALIASNLGNEVNNLATSILGNSTLIMQESFPGSALQKRVNNIRLATQRLTEYNRRLLTISGRGSYLEEKINFIEFIQKFSVEFNYFYQILSNSDALKGENSANSSGVTGSDSRTGLDNDKITFDFQRLTRDYSLVGIWGDKKHLSVLLRNLLQNAIEAFEEGSGSTKKDRKISLSSSLVSLNSSFLKSCLSFTQQKEGSYLSIKIANNAKSIPEEHLLKIFEPFYSTKSPGRGLGLVVVTDIIKNFKGCLKITSIPEGNTSFEIFLPCEEAVYLDQTVQAQKSPQFQSPSFKHLQEKELIQSA